MPKKRSLHNSDTVVSAMDMNSVYGYIVPSREGQEREGAQHVFLHVKSHPPGTGLERMR